MPNESNMSKPGRELNVENFKNLGRHNIAQFYNERLFPRFNNELEDAYKHLQLFSASHKAPEGYNKVIELAHQIIQQFSIHTTKEIKMLMVSSIQDKEKIAAEKKELLKEHRIIQSLFEELNKLSISLRSIPEMPSTFRLADARFNNLRQDFSLLFFLEEEYLFPRLLPTN